MNEQEINRLRSAIACATDLLNTWAREVGAEECDDPFRDEFALRDLVERVWMTCLQRTEAAFKLVMKE